MILKPHLSTLLFCVGALSAGFAPAASAQGNAPAATEAALTTTGKPTDMIVTEHTVLQMERAALERWCNGDPSGFLEISADDVVYFDPFQKQRLDGLPALTELYEGIRGMVKPDSYEMVNPCVQDCGGAVVLTFNFNSRRGEHETRWNCTEVYRRDPDGWRIIQTHWSFTKAGLPAVENN